MHRIFHDQEEGDNPSDDEDEMHIVAASAIGATASGMPRKPAYPSMAMATSVCEQYDDQDEPFDEQEHAVAASAIGAETPSGDHEHHNDEEHVVTTSAMGVTASGMPKKLAYPPMAMATREPSVAMATCVLL